ncbi:NAD(P)-binding domain-containing protein [Chelatococcus asaccharovorans]|uniref:Cation diffusion facilitator CzcD-associated flavoprotein CzcO n=1 Tax=Chelatococcus asaccharovorans TaxID=28210 RepID=A0A2V3U591_9HYPH|nr:NAD(P)-binding domain-containing protein [Chelatococcus asaccharovorans]MBS7703773.1 NAD(P)/FAD-dependent oxidoreductase [Chelatococcus asaccharovorans]PXW57933.1 cation diffusion facilitator CzcD-associated flavoprotein CzcO [Chelatococcus asaccharovorans]
MSSANIHTLAAQTLRLLGPDPADWAPPRAGIEHNVVVVGGGHSGIAIAYALRRAGIGRVRVIDAAPTVRETGIWRSTARMVRLRTPKSLVGPELAHVGLSFQAWFEAQHGAKAYAAIDRIERTDWADYIDWYRETLGISVETGVHLDRVEPSGALLRLHLHNNGAPESVVTRKLVLANGFLGAGGSFVPPELRSLPASHRLHTAQPIDPTSFSGKTVAVVGAAASAFDAAAVILEAGAAAVHLLSRRPELAATAVNKVRAYPGAYDNYPDLPDSIRWRQALRYRRAGTTPPPDSVERVLAFPQFRLHLGAPVVDAALKDGQVRLATPAGWLAVDVVIAATGYAVGADLRPELADIADQIQTWSDRHTPQPSEADVALGGHPYLGPALEYRERHPGRAPYLGNIHVFNPAGFVSRGLPVGDVPSHKRDIPAVVAGISRDLFLDDLDVHEARIFQPVAPDFDLSFYARALHVADAAAE